MGERIDEINDDVFLLFLHHREYSACMR
jgi:hypothetical protein